MLNTAKNESFKRGNILSISTDLLREAENYIAKDAQKSLASEMVKVDRSGRRRGS